MNVGVSLHLALQILKEIAFHFAHLPALQASNVDMVAQAMAFVKVPVPMDVEQIKLIKQTAALEHFQGAINGNAVNVRIDFLRALQNRVGAQMLLGLIHHFEQDPALARQPHALALQRAAQTARLGMRIDTFAG